MDVPAARNGFLQKARRVLHVVEEKRLALRTPGAEQWQALSLARFHMLRAINELVLFKEDDIFLPLILAGPGPSAALARRLKDANLDLQQDYDGFVQHWALQSILSVDERYRAEAEAMMMHIDRAVHDDMAAVVALLDDLPDDA